MCPSRIFRQALLLGALPALLLAACSSKTSCFDTGTCENTDSDAGTDADVASCEANQRYCAGSTLLTCNADGTGPTDEGQACGTADACEAARATGTCSGQACRAGEGRCGGGEVETTALECNATQTGFDTTAYCSDTDTQCNPATGECFRLYIDATEVTRAAYAAFLANPPATQTPACAWNDSFAPDEACLSDASVCQDAAGACDEQPQVCVDWCDAQAYCVAQGKRLCGRIAGGMNPYDRHDDAGSSEWLNACSAGGQFEYGSGTSVPSGPQHCNYAGTQLATTHAVGTRTACKSPSPTYAQAFDLSGNVAEWEDSCELAADDEAAGAADACRTRGGSFATPLAALACRAVPSVAKRRGDYAPDLGFRCCGQ